MHGLHSPDLQAPARMALRAAVTAVGVQRVAVVAVGAVKQAVVAVLGVQVAVAAVAAVQVHAAVKMPGGTDVVVAPRDWQRAGGGAAMRQLQGLQLCCQGCDERWQEQHPLYCRCCGVLADNIPLQKVPPTIWCHATTVSPTEKLLCLCHVCKGAF